MPMKRDRQCAATVTAVSARNRFGNYRLRPGHGCDRIQLFQENGSGTFLRTGN